MEVNELQRYSRSKSRGPVGSASIGFKVPETMVDECWSRTSLSNDKSE